MPGAADDLILHGLGPAQDGGLALGGSIRLGDEAEFFDTEGIPLHNQGFSEVCDTIVHGAALS